MFNIKKFLNLEYYTSTLDLFLAKYRQQHPAASHSQRKEIEKYTRIYQLRDHAKTEPAPKKIWDKF